jgi:two-component system sensor histidine kinase KdpD
MRRALTSCLRAVVAISLLNGIAALCFRLHANRATASMALVLAVLGVAALGDWLLAVISSTAAGFALSWYYIEAVGSLRITTGEGWITFSALLITALGGSRLAINARRRADEAERRRQDMDRLQRLGQALLLRTTLAEVAECAISQVVELFRVDGAEIRLEGAAGAVRAGSFASAGQDAVVQLDQHSVLEIRGTPPSPEVLSALSHFVGLALGRARGLEERARVEAERRGEELRSIVLNGLAHNFRTPLTAIKAASSSLRGASYIPEGPGRELAQIIDEEADRLDRLIGESISFARIESHRASPRIEQCGTGEIVEGVVSRLARHLQGRELVVNVPAGLPSISGDRFLLEQMLFEVVDNAWKYSTPGSRIRIAAAVEEKNVVLTVESSGDEIADNERELIFAKFYRGVVRRSSIEGTGVGLAVARAIANAHGGSIRLDSEPGGQVFRFTLPTGNNEGQVID